LSTQRPTFWFAVKTHGWGWGMPVRWQGWVVLFGYLLLTIYGVYRFMPQQNVRGLILYLVALTAVLMLVLAWKGERPLRWRWGKD
jgi:hypothetical protein